MTRTVNSISELSAEDFKDWPASNEEWVRRFLDQMIAEATAFLGKLGHPTRPGLYASKDNGPFVWVTDRDDARLELNMTYSGWPAFLKGEPVSKESFAVDLIHRARVLRESIEKGDDPWFIGAVSVDFADAYHRFITESRGIADHAFRGSTVLRGGGKGHASRSVKKAKALDAIALAVAQCNDEMKDADASKLAAHIRAKVNGAIAPARALGVKTIQKHIQKLRKQGGPT